MLEWELWAGTLMGGSWSVTGSLEAAAPVIISASRAELREASVCLGGAGLQQRPGAPWDMAVPIVSLPQIGPGAGPQAGGPLAPRPEGGGL